MKTETVYAVLGIVTVFGSAWAQQLERRSTDAEEIARFLEVHRTDYNKGDADAWAAAYAEDATFAGDTQTLGGRDLQGRQAIRDYFARVFRDYPTRQANVANLRIRVYNEGPAATAILNVEQKGQRTDVTGRQLDLNTRESITVVKIQGKWLIVNHHFSEFVRYGACRSGAMRNGYLTTNSLPASGTPKIRPANKGSALLSVLKMITFLHKVVCVPPGTTLQLPELHFS